VTDTTAYDQWHATNPTGIGPWYELVREHLRQQEGILAGARALEVGGGECRFSTWLAENGAASVIGSDFSPAVIDCARRTASPPNVTFEVQDAQALTYPDDEFDLVVSCEMMEHLPDAPRAIEEFARVLRPGGTLLLTFPNYMSITGVHRLYRKAQGRDEMEGGQPIANLTTYPQIRRWVRAAGFSIESTTGRGHYLPLRGRQGLPLDLTRRRPRMRRAGKLVAMHVLFHATAPT
jgi:ubiquinone/menaquinone biosynthesis C-methylase UbiE